MVLATGQSKSVTGPEPLTMKLCPFTLAGHYQGEGSNTEVENTGDAVKGDKA
jgi:hypothetical protein